MPVYTMRKVSKKQAAINKELKRVYKEIEELKEDSRESNQVLVLECGDEMGKKVSAGSR